MHHHLSNEIRIKGEEVAVHYPSRSLTAELMKDDAKSSNLDQGSRDQDKKKNRGALSSNMIFHTLKQTKKKIELL